MQKLCDEISGFRSDWESRILIIKILLLHTAFSIKS